MSSGKVGLFKQLIAMVSMIALIFGLSVRPVLAAEAPAGEGSSGTSSGSTASGSSAGSGAGAGAGAGTGCLLYTSPSPRDLSTSRMPSSA